MLPFRRAAALVVVAAGCAAADPAHAKPARCATTDDGAFACEFRLTGPNGSFQISAPGKPTYALDIVEPGVGYGFVTLGGRSTPLPGRYLRRADDRACWRSDATGAEICAR